MLQHRPYDASFSEVPETASQKSIFTIGITMLVVFAFLRPITLTFVDVNLFGLSAFEIFGAAISYMLLIPVLLNFRNLKLDRMTLLSIYFCLFCVMSIIWGSRISIVATGHFAICCVSRRPYIRHRSKANGRYPGSINCRLYPANHYEFIQYIFRQRH